MNSLLVLLPLRAQEKHLKRHCMSAMKAFLAKYVRCVEQCSSVFRAELALRVSCDFYIILSIQYHQYQAARNQRVCYGQTSIGIDLMALFSSCCDSGSYICTAETRLSPTGTRRSWTKRHQNWWAWGYPRPRAAAAGEAQTYPRWKRDGTEAKGIELTQMRDSEKSGPAWESEDNAFQVIEWWTEDICVASDSLKAITSNVRS